MSGEHFEGEDVGYVPEDMDFPQNRLEEHEEGDVIDDSGFHQLQHGDDDDNDGEDGGDDIDDEQVGSLGDDVEINFPENQFDGNDVENFTEIDDAIADDVPQEEEQIDGGDVNENFGSPEKEVPREDSKGVEIKKWPGWPGENVFRMLVASQKVGSIIGRKGEFIKKITEETRARVKILDGPPGTAERAVVSKYE